jgi:hypothetical protein
MGACTPEAESPDPMFTTAVAENGRKKSIHPYNRSGLKK